MVARSKPHPKFHVLLADRAAAMRLHPTISESRLWHQLRSSRLGVAFRRQVPLGRYIADFAAPSIRLVVEVDGLYHARRIAADARRDRHFSRLGYRVLHLEAELVMEALPLAVERIQEAIAEAMAAVPLRR